MEADTSAYAVLTETVINYAAHTPVIYVYIALYVKKYGLYSPVFNLYFLIQNINGGISVPLANADWHRMTDGLCHASEQCFWLGRGGACAVRPPRALHFLSSKLNKCSNCQLQLYLSHMKIPKLKSTIQRRYLRLILFLSVFKKYIIIKHDGKKAQGWSKDSKMAMMASIHGFQPS